MAESFDAVLAEMRTACDWPRLGHTGVDFLTGLANRLQSAHEAEVAERDRMVGEQLAIAERAKAEALRQQQERLAATVRADRAVGLLREWSSYELPWNDDLSNRVTAFLSEQAGERESVT